MKKIIAFASLILAVLMFTTSCININQSPDESLSQQVETEDTGSAYNSETDKESVHSETEEITEKDTTEVESGKSKYEQMAINFMKAIMSEDYETALSLSSIKDKTFLRAEDLGWYIVRTSLADFAGVNHELTDCREEKISNTERSVFLTYKIDNLKFKLVLDDNNEWGVVFDEWYYTDWYISLPKGLDDATINGASVKGYEYKTAGYDMEYMIPAIPKREISVKYTTDFNTVDAKYTPHSSEKSPEYVGYVGTITDIAEKERIYSEVLNYLNDLYAVYNNGGTVEDMAKLMSKSCTAEFIQGVYNKIQSCDANHKLNITFTYVGDYLKDNFKYCILPVEKDTLRVVFYCTKLVQSGTVNTWGQIYVKYEDGQMKLLNEKNDKFLMDSDPIWHNKW